MPLAAEVAGSGVRGGRGRLISMGVSVTLRTRMTELEADDDALPKTIHMRPISHL
jgi:hypothetical protein